MAAFGFLIALTIAFFAYFFAKIFKLPGLAILLIVASLVGPNGLKMVGFEEVEIFSSIGSMFLLYMIGLEFKTSSLVKYGPRGFVFALLKMTLVAIPVIFASIYFFNLLPLEAFILGFSLSITSTAIFSKVAHSMGISRSKETKQLFAELIWEDIFAVFFLILITSYVNTGNIEMSFVLSLAYFTLPYFIVRKISELIVHRLPRDTEIYFLFSMAIAGVLVILSSAMNVPAELAAFLAGSIAANFKEIDRIKRNLNVLSSTFIIFFFFSLGMNANISIFLNSYLFLFILFVLIINILFKVFSTSLITLFFGGTGRSAAFSALLMISVGEFSLLIAKETSALFSTLDVFSVVSGVVFISSLVSWYFPSMFPVYADFISRVSKALGLLRKTKNKTMFNISYEVTKIEKTTVSSRLINGFSIIEDRIILTIIFLLAFSYIPILFPENPYSTPFSYISLFFSLVLILSSLISLKKNKVI